MGITNNEIIFFYSLHKIQNTYLMNVQLPYLHKKKVKYGVVWTQVDQLMGRKLKLFPPNVFIAHLFLCLRFNFLEFLVDYAIIIACENNSRTKNHKHFINIILLLLHIVQNAGQGFSLLFTPYYNALKHHTFLQTNAHTK